MLLPIPIGYFVAVFLVISGVLNCIQFLESQQEFTSRAEMLNALACEGWGIIAASVILLLIQINKQLERIRFAATPPAEAARPISRKLKAAQTEQPAAPQPKPRQMYPNSPIPGGGRVPQTTGGSDEGKLNYFKVN